MNFDWTPQEQEIKKRVAGLFDQSAISDMEILEQAEPPEIKEITMRCCKLLAGAGYFGLGMGPAARNEIMTLIAAQEELAKISASLFLAVEVTARLFGGLVAGYGTATLKGEILDPLKQGSLIGAVAIAEAPVKLENEEKSVPGKWNTIAHDAGQGYVLSGSKSYATNGPIADWLAVAGSVADRSAVFLLPSSSPGLIIGERLRTLGYNGLAVSSLELNEVHVDNNYVLGPFDDDAPLNWLRLVEDMILSVASVGLMGRTLTVALNHARNHHRNGKPIFAHQEVRFKLAEMLTMYQTAQLLIYRAGWMYGDAQKEAETVIRAAKVFTAESAERVSSMALQILAGQGYVWGNAVERGYREAKLAGLAGTSSEKARMAVAGDLLNQYR